LAAFVGIVKTVCIFLNNGNSWARSIRVQPKKFTFVAQPQFA
jgi:hypothetical protein